MSRTWKNRESLIARREFAKWNLWATKNCVMQVTFSIVSFYDFQVKWRLYNVTWCVTGLNSNVVSFEYTLHSLPFITIQPNFNFFITTLKNRTYSTAKFFQRTTTFRSRCSSFYGSTKCILCHVSHLQKKGN